jgi:hypothetical protein
MTQANIIASIFNTYTWETQPIKLMAWHNSDRSLISNENENKRLHIIWSKTIWSNPIRRKPCNRKSTWTKTFWSKSIWSNDFFFENHMIIWSLWTKSHSIKLFSMKWTFDQTVFRNQDNTLKLYPQHIHSFLWPYYKDVC